MHRYRFMPQYNDRPHDPHVCACVCCVCITRTVRRAHACAPSVQACVRAPVRIQTHTHTHAHAHSHTQAHTTYISIYIQMKRCGYRYRHILHYTGWMVERLQAYMYASIMHVCDALLRITCLGLCTYIQHASDIPPIHACVHTPIRCGWRRRRLRSAAYQNKLSGALPAALGALTDLVALCARAPKPARRGRPGAAALPPSRCAHARVRRCAATWTRTA
jgi:hypothetical protein